MPRCLHHPTCFPAGMSGRNGGSEDRDEASDHGNTQGTDRSRRSAGARYGVTGSPRWQHGKLDSSTTMPHCWHRGTSGSNQSREHGSHLGAGSAGGIQGATTARRSEPGHSPSGRAVPIQFKPSATGTILSRASSRSTSAPPRRATLRELRSDAGADGRGHRLEPGDSTLVIDTIAKARELFGQRCSQDDAAAGERAQLHVPQNVRWLEATAAGAGSAKYAQPSH